LEGSSGKEKGGLIIMKKKQGSFEFKKPTISSVSLFGLDKLAAVKRKSDSQNELSSKKSKVTSYKDYDDDGPPFSLPEDPSNLCRVGSSSGSTNVLISLIDLHFTDVTSHIFVKRSYLKSMTILVVQIYYICNVFVI
jgi:hypothetical protein